MTKQQSKYGSAIAEELLKRQVSTPVDEKIAAAVHELQNTGNQSIPADGGVTSASVYLHFGLTVNPNPFHVPQGTFSGNAGALSTPGGGILRGNIYSSDFDKLFSTTVSFEFHATLNYLGMTFWDGSSNFLGHYEAGALSTVFGIGGGTGSWSE